jgi:hypothetical protein
MSDFPRHETYRNLLDLPNEYDNVSFCAVCMKFGSEMDPKISCLYLCRKQMVLPIEILHLHVLSI